MPRYKGSPQVYEVTLRFRDKCLLGTESLLWGEPDIWTSANLRLIRERFVESPDTTEASFWDKIAQQFAGSPAECFKILADSFILYSLPSRFIRAQTKWSFINRIVSLGNLPEPSSNEISEALGQGFTRTGTRYHVKYMQLWLIIMLGLRVKELPNPKSVMEDPWATARLLDECVLGLRSDSRAWDMRHAILHLLFPDTFERMINTGHKRRVVEAFGKDIPAVAQIIKEDFDKSGLIQLDRQVKAVRIAKEQAHSGDFDFYSQDISRQWRDTRTKPIGPPDDPDEGATSVEPIDVQLQDLVQPLKDTGQLILYGPPGTGKTYYALRLAQALIAEENFDADLRRLASVDRAVLQPGTIEERKESVWWLVANPGRWSWGSLNPGDTIEFQYGRVQRHFEDAQIGDRVFGYEATPTLAVKAIGKIVEPLHRTVNQGQAVTVELVELLEKPIPYAKVKEHPILKFSEPIRMGNHGTLFRLGSAETRILYEMAYGGTKSDREPAQEPEVSYLRLCTFHPSYGYEEFIEGFRPSLSTDGHPYYRVEDGVFKQLCSDARQQPDKTFVLIIDEINRGNIPRIFGELITLIEKDKRWRPGCPREYSVVLPASQESFAVPENVYLIGTMNTADKSIALLDTALRRRFAFRELLPDSKVLSGVEISGIRLDALLELLNRRIIECVDRNLQIGHAYFMDAGEPITTAGQLAAILRDRVFPLLQDYCYDDYNVLRQILGDQIVDLKAKRFRPEAVAPGNDEGLLEVVSRLLSQPEVS